MTQVTVRRVEESWVAKAKAEARRRGVSMNQVLVEALARGLGVSREPRKNGLEKFAGCMPFESERERGEWEQSMKVFEQVDEELWK